MSCKIAATFGRIADHATPGSLVHGVAATLGTTMSATGYCTGKEGVLRPAAAAPTQAGSYKHSGELLLDYKNFTFLDRHLSTMRTIFSIIILTKHNNLLAQMHLICRQVHDYFLRMARLTF
jgi:hypothetical protein